jgi:hypothetical protein
LAVRLQRREPMPLIEVPSSDVALEGLQIEAVGVEFLCEVDEPRPQTSPGPFRVHVEVGKPPVVEDQQCHETRSGSSTGRRSRIPSQR